MITPDLLRKIEPEFHAIEEAHIETDGQIIGWHATCFSGDLEPIGSGCATERNTARRIAVAEAMERAFLKRIAVTDASSFQILQYPTSCGLAAGFDLRTTQFRSLCEAVERWMLEQWIDKNCPFDEIQSQHILLNPMAKYFAASFANIRFFQKSTAIRYEGQLFSLNCGVVVGMTASGAFLGARVTSPEDDVWTHAIIEAWRHKVIFEKIRNEPASTLSEVRRKIQFFGFNKDVVLTQVTNVKKNVWQVPTLQLAKQYETGFPGVFVWRHLADGFTGWQHGPIERFLY